MAVVLDHSTASPLQRQLARVRRRLFLQTLLEVLTWAWFLALVLAAGWFLAQPFLVREAGPRLCWQVLGGLVGTATLGAILLARVHAPSRVRAALALDERFRLQERTTTALLLRPEEVGTPAGQALLADVDARLQPLRVGERFPLRLPRSAFLVPVAALALALLAWLYQPTVGTDTLAGPQPLATTPAVKTEIEEARRQLQKKSPVKGPDDRQRSKELERLEGEIDKAARKPLDTREQAREVVKDMTSLEDQIEKRDKELAQRTEALKEQLKQAERLSRKKDRDGPAKDMKKALDNGDFRKAQDQADRLARKLQESEQAERLRRKLEDKKLSDKERQEARDQLDQLQELTRQQKEQTEKQLEDLQDQLEHLTRKKPEEEELLRERAQRGELDKEELQRELDELEKNRDQLGQDTEDLKELADQLGECRKCLKEGKDAEAAEKFARAAAQMGKLGGKGDAEARDLALKLQRVQAARQAICRALNPQGSNPASGRRPESKEGETAFKEEQVRSDLDKGRLQVVDHVPGEGFKGPRKPAEMADEIRQASQQAPEAIDRQRLPRSASDMARGYFEKLRGPERDKK